jgi:hypothetical protein
VHTTATADTGVAHSELYTRKAESLEVSPGYTTQ